MEWKQTGWQVETMAGWYDVEYSRHTRDYSAWFWPRNGNGEPISAPNGDDFATLEDALAACEKHAGERNRLRAVR